MYLHHFCVTADERIVDRYKGGFVHRFGREACCITEQYCALVYRKIVTKDSTWLAFEFTGEIRETPEFTSGRCSYPWPFDFAAYVMADNVGKKSLIASSMQSAALWVARKEGWTTAPIEDAYRTIVQRNFVFEGVSKKSWLSPSKAYRARVYFNFDLDGVNLHAVLYRNRNKQEVGRVFLGREIPRLGCLDECLARGRWVTDTDFRLATEFGLMRNLLAADFSSFMR